MCYNLKMKKTSKKQSKTNSKNQTGDWTGMFQTVLTLSSAIKGSQKAVKTLAKIRLSQTEAEELLDKRMEVPA